MYGTNGAINRMIRKKGVYGKDHTKPKTKKDPEPENLSKTIQVDGCGFDTYTAEPDDVASPFCAVFNKRKKARAYLEKVRKMIETYGSYLLLELKDHNGEPILFSIDEGFGWRSADGIRIRKVSPTEWRVVFPPAEMLG